MRNKKICAAFLTVVLLLFSMPAVPAAAAVSVRCDTAGTVMLTSKTAYTYTAKITVQGSGKAPSVWVGNSGDFAVKLVSHKGQDYFYRIFGYGKGGDATGVYTSVAGQKAVRQFIVSMYQGSFSNGFFQVQGNSLYYNYNFALYRMNLDGSGKTKITDENVGWKSGGFVVSGSNAYYIDEKTENLYQIGLDGKGKKPLSTQRVDKLTVYEGRVYYLMNAHEISNGGILMCWDPASGTSARVASVADSVVNYQILEGTVYYTSTPMVSNGKANGYSEWKSVGLDGGQEHDYGSLPGSSHHNFTAQGDYFYYKEDFFGRLLRLDRNTGNVDTLADNIGIIQTSTPEWIYASDENNGNILVRIDLTTGSRTPLLSTQKTPGLSELQVAGSYLYGTFGNTFYSVTPAAENGGVTMKEYWNQGVSSDSVRGIARFDLNGNLIQVLLENKGS